MGGLDLAVKALTLKLEPQSAGRVVGAEKPSESRLHWRENAYAAARKNDRAINYADILIGARSEHRANRARWQSVFFSSKDEDKTRSTRNRGSLIVMVRRMDSSQSEGQKVAVPLQKPR